MSVHSCSATRLPKRPGTERPLTTWPLWGLVATWLSLLPTPSPAQFGAQRMEMNEQQLISWAFENQQSIAAAQQHAGEELAGQIEFVAVIGTLTEEQRRRLELAGEGDISRFFAEAQVVIDRQPTGSLEQDQWNAVWQQLSPIRERYGRGLTGDRSLFRKTIRTTLTPEQFTQYQELITARATRNYRLLVAAAVADLERKVPLTRKQRERLIELIATRTEPPRGKFSSYYQYYFVMYRMSELNESELKAIFEAAEFQRVRQIMQNAQGYKGQFEAEERGGVGGLLDILF